MTAEIVDLVEIMARRAAFNFTASEREAVIATFHDAGVFDFYYVVDDNGLPKWFEFRNIPDGQPMTLGKQSGEFYLFDADADRLLASGPALSEMLDLIALPPPPVAAPPGQTRGNRHSRR